MTGSKLYTAIGLMSGTSLDGIDAAMIRTDGVGVAERVGFYTAPYDSALRDQLRACLGLTDDKDGRVAAAAEAMTRAHAEAVAALRAEYPDPVDLIGFHGQTIAHDPDRKFTWQIGDASMLARETGIDVIYDFRTADVMAGGQGAPLLPLYHRALASALPKPVAILNIGGVANITYIGADDAVLAFDTGPGNALINDWVRAKTGEEYDADGRLAKSGCYDEAKLVALLKDPYFAKPPPKSLDRDHWKAMAAQVTAGASPEDGAALLTQFTIRTIRRALVHLPQEPLAWYVTGGGRKNSAIMDGLRKELNVPVEPVDALGWNGDAMEAEGFAYLAVRSLLGLPLSEPGTTGVPQSMTGGKRIAA